MPHKWEPHPYRLFCPACEKDLDEKKAHARCLDCGGALDVSYNLKSVRKEKPYLFPLRDEASFVSLREGGTHLYHAEKLGKKLGAPNLYIKYEATNPTGVFKDRGTFVEVSKARELGAKALIVASSGNMAASCAAYAAKAGLPIYVFVPEHVPIGKLAQMVSYGAHVLKIHGSYNDCVKLVHELAPRFSLYLLGDYVFRREGQKSLAYELVEQMGGIDGDASGAAPDVVIVPTGAGTHLAALWRGFREFHALGLADKLPRLVAVQPDGAAVLASAFAAHLKTHKPWKKTHTMCSAVDVEDPNDGMFALQALYDSGGTALKLSDLAALEAQHLAAREEGLFMEHSSALAVAAVTELLQQKLIQKNETVVAIATGSGLKDPEEPLQYLPKPLAFPPDLEKVSRHLQAIISPE